MVFGSSFALFCFSVVFASSYLSLLFFFNDTATPEIYTLSLHDALPISVRYTQDAFSRSGCLWPVDAKGEPLKDRKSGSAGMPRPISYAVFCLKKKQNTTIAKYTYLIRMLAEPMSHIALPAGVTDAHEL